MTQPPPATPPPLSSSHSVKSHLAAATDALVALVDAGVSLHDSRFDTLLTLIHRHSQPPPTTPHHASSTTPDKPPPVHPQHPQKVDQAAITAARIVYDNSSIAPSSSTQRTPNFTSPLTPSPPAASPHPPTHSPHAPVPAPSTPSDPTSIFQAARAITPDSRRAKRKDLKSPARSTPRRRASPADHLPFSAQQIADLSAEHLFQLKAQLNAFRHLTRGLPLSPELLVAARATPPTIVHPRPAPSVARCVSEVVPGQTTTPCAPYVIPAATDFDPCLLRRFPPNHIFSEEDVILPGEKNVSPAQLRQRVLLAQAHHNRLYARSLSIPNRPSSSSNVDMDLDPLVCQQHHTLLNHFNTDTPQPNRRPLSVSESISQARHSHERKSQRRRDRGPPAIPQSILRDDNAAPLTVDSTPRCLPDFPTLLADRKRLVNARIHTRASEIADMRVAASNDVRAVLDAEHRELRLLNLQRSVRSKIMACMRRVLDRPGISDLRPSKIAKMKRPMPSQHGAYAPRTEATYQAQQQSWRRSRRVNTLQALMNHTTQYKAFVTSRTALKKRLMKDLERYFRDKSREEERRKKKEQIDRLRALRNNNEDEYLELLKTTKNKRLIQLLKQTDEYLVQIGAQVERQKQAARDEDGADSMKEDEKPDDDDVIEANGEGPGSPSDDDELSQLKKRRNDYYTITHTISEKVHQPPSLVGGKLKHYQLEGLEWLVSLYNNNLNGILADEMGLGKTIQTLSLITYLVEVKQVQGPFLVIVPLSVISNWVRELDRWAPSLVKVVYKGDPTTRKNIQMYEMHGGNFNVLLTTYEFIVKDKQVLGRIRWKYIIMDEGHRMKNADCKLALTLGAKYTSRNRLLLTGTPLQNNMTELWALLNFLLPSIFSSAETFETWFNAPFQASALGDSTELNEEENLLIISRLHQVLRPFMLRRLKTDVESQLPDKVEIVFRCEMSIWQRVLYRQMRAKLGIAGGAGNVGTRSFNNMVMQLKKVCNHPYLFYNEEELMSLPPEFLMRTAGKFELLDHCLRKLKRAGHRVLIFSQMTAALDYLEYFLTSIDMKHLRLDGTTKADDRQDMLEMFNAADSEYFCFLLSTRAGGLGLNLQTADTVIIFDSDWNPMMDLQAQDRAHRIGQTKEVRVFRLICSGSIEVKILERASRKLQIESQVIQAGQFNNKSSDNDRQEMLKDLLRQQTDEVNANVDVTPLEQINRSLARGDDEFEFFQQIDTELKEESGGRTRLLVDEKELPAWVLKPEQEVKPKEQIEAEYIQEHGRGRRKRKEVVYDDNLTEKEWTIAMEEDGDIVEAVRRKRRRKSAPNGTADGLSDDNGEENHQASSKGSDKDAEEVEDVEMVEVETATSSMNGSKSVEEKGLVKKLEPFVDPELNQTPKPQRRKRGRPRKKPVRSAS